MNLMQLEEKGFIMQLYEWKMERNEGEREKKKKMLPPSKITVSRTERSSSTFLVRRPKGLQRRQAGR